MKKSNLDVAFEIVSKRDTPISFNELWNELTAIQEMNNSDTSSISKFYTALSLDGRFITVGENKWDLRTRYKFDKVHIDMKDVYVDEDLDEENDVDQNLDENDSYEDEEDDNDDNYDDSYEDDEDEEKDSSYEMDY